MKSKEHLPPVGSGGTSIHGLVPSCSRRSQRRIDPRWNDTVLRPRAAVPGGDEAAGHQGGPAIGNSGHCKTSATRSTARGTDPSSPLDHEARFSTNP